MKPIASANLGPDWTNQQEHEMTTSADLLKINVNEHTEKKNGLTYLSWAWAWAEVLKIDPKAGWSISCFKTGEVGPLYFPDGSAMVGVNVTIRNDTKGSVLPVMDHRNKAIKNPDAFAINTAIMRCLAKAIAMHGLGLYIYAGEDLPEGDENAATEKTTEAHKPTRLAKGPLTEKQHAFVAKIAAAISEKFGAGEDWAAYEEMTSAIDVVNNSGSDGDLFKISLFDVLKAPHRAAIKSMEDAEKAKGSAQ